MLQRPLPKTSSSLRSRICFAESSEPRPEGAAAISRQGWTARLRSLRLRHHRQRLPIRNRQHPIRNRQHPIRNRRHPIRRAATSRARAARAVRAKAKAVARVPDRMVPVTALAKGPRNATARMAATAIVGPTMMKATERRAELVGKDRSNHMRRAGVPELQPANGGGSAQVNVIGKPHP